MSRQYILADAVSAINNAQKTKKKEIYISYSKFINNIFQVIMNLGYIKTIKKIKIKNKFQLLIKLKYDKKNKIPVIKEFHIVSKPSKRVFKSYKNIKKFYNGLGNRIISSSQGIITDCYAVNNKIGGEMLCNIM